MAAPRTPLPWPCGKASALRVADLSSIPAFAVEFFTGLGLTSDLEIGTSAATQPGAWRSEVSIGTGWLGVSML